MALIGYGVGSSYHHVMKGFSYAGYVLGVAAAVAVVVVIVHRYRSYKEATGPGEAARSTEAVLDTEPSRPAPSRTRGTPVNRRRRA